MDAMPLPRTAHDIFPEKRLYAVSVGGLMAVFAGHGLIARGMCV